MVNPDLLVDDKSYAVSVADETNNITEGDISDESGENYKNDKIANNDLGDSFGGSADDDLNYSPDFTLSDEDTGAGIMPLANVNPSLSLTVTNSDKKIETVQGGDTAYSDHLVTIMGEEVTNYTLSMSTSSANLTKPSGSSSTAANITGAGGVTGNSMPANRWGYAVTEEGTTSYGGLTYNSVPTTATTVASGNASSSNTLSVKKKVVIAAKFGEDAAPGNYRQNITLSAVANATTVTFKITYNSNGGGTAPAASSTNSMENSVNFTLPGQGSMSKSGYNFVGWSTSQSATSGSAAGSSYTVSRTNPSVTLYAVWKSAGAQWSNGTYSVIENMQDIGSGFCKNNSNIAEGETIELKDSRDQKTYTIVKLNGNCWMGQNLSLTGPLTLTSADSDVSSNWTLPASVGSGGTNSNNVNTSDTWDTSNYNSIQVRTGNTSLSNWKQGYGNYYSWPAATAGTGTTSVTNKGADSSICPKGWKLPPNSGDGSYTNLTNAYKSSWLSGQTINGVSGMAGYRFGLNSTTVSKDANFWPATGSILLADASIHSPDSGGYYWSSTARNSTDAYHLYFSSSGFNTSTFNYARYYGFSVRCVASY